MWKVALTRVNI